MNSGRSTPHKFQVTLIDSAKDDFKRLDGSVKPKVAAQLLKIQDNPFCGEALGVRMSIDLTGFRKIYVDSKRLRIVWKVLMPEAQAVVYAIGRRDKGDVYKLVSERLG